MLRRVHAYRLMLAGLLTLFLAAPLAAFHHTQTHGPAILEARSDSDGAALTLADVLRVVITLKGDKGLRVEAAVKPARGSGWEMLASSTSGPKAGEDGQVRWRQTLTLAPITLGSPKVELTELVYRDGASEPHKIAWQPFAVAVQAQIKDLDPRHARDITATEDLPAVLPGPDMPWGWIVLLSLILLALAGLWLVARRRARPGPSSALRKALRECDRVLAMKLPEQGQGKSFVILLSGIVRRYIERRFDLPARRQTTAELLHALDARSDVNAAPKQWLHTFFAEVDPVKFAAANATPDACHRLMAEVRQFLGNLSTKDTKEHEENKNRESGQDTA